MHSAEGLNTLIHSPEVTELIRSVNATAQVTEQSLTRIDAEIGPEVRVLLKNALEAATALLRDSQQLVRRVDAQVAPMADGIQKTLDAVRTTLKDSDQLIRHVDTRVTPMVDNLMETSTRLRATIARMQQVVDGDVVRVLQDTNRTLQEFTGAARSFRLLADYLERIRTRCSMAKVGSEIAHVSCLEETRGRVMGGVTPGLGACASTPSHFYVLNTCLHGRRCRPRRQPRVRSSGWGRSHCRSIWIGRRSSPVWVAINWPSASSIAGPSPCRTTCCACSPRIGAPHPHGSSPAASLAAVR